MQRRHRNGLGHFPCILKNIWISRCCRGEGATTPTRDPSGTIQASPPIESPALLPTSTPAIPGGPATSESLFACEQASQVPLRLPENFAHIGPGISRKGCRRAKCVGWFWEIMRPRNVLLWPCKGVKESLSWDPFLWIQTSFVLDQMPRKFKATEGFVLLMEKGFKAIEHSHSSFDH